VHLALPVTLVAALVALPACLEARSGQHLGTADVADTVTAADVSNVTGSACLAGCDDGDPCTYDWCDEATGLCGHERADENEEKRRAMECTRDEDCAGPCAEGICHLVDDGCGVVDAWCERIPLPGACPAECSSAGVIDGSALSVDAGYGKVGGTAVAGYPLTCDDDSDGCSCVADVTLAGFDGAPVVMRTATSEPPFQCQVYGCGAAVADRCEPMHAGAAYWAWGTPVSVSGWDSDGDQLWPPPIGLATDGWCLQTNAAGLSGRYTGEMTIAGPGTASFTARVTATGGLLGVTIEAPECCPACDCDTGPIEEQEAAIEAFDGFVVVRLVLYGTAVEATLRSWHNTLSGPWEVVGDVDGAAFDGDWDGLMAGGELTLTKLP